jgi:uncharacterized protein (DUF1330 family)
MARSIVIGLSMLAGAALGAAAISELGAQGRPPGAFAVIDVSDITDPEVFSRQLVAKETATLVPFGGQYVIRTDAITAVDGTPPKRLVVIAFNNPQIAKAWASSAAEKEIESLGKKSAKSRVFIADGAIQ